MKTHLLDRTDARPVMTVCRLQRATVVAISSTDLLAASEPCTKCLEWLVEQGQLAARRLATLTPQREPHL